MEKINILNKIYKNHKLPADLYYQVMTIIKYDMDKNLEETNNFLNALPLGIRTKVNLVIYRNTY